ncbi:hypothetical protein Rsub_02661 [Raphidocelis subcapitata]|uniref:Uncharacterized protein n=1 Tax=Raphidocelis subcapitata TaxID=307507 RepID=A0A2V0NYF2_9CHLO|nr:hypothetical protein Rsub_02661 [Raphidocelis subcapitata]|eukprot:GBF89957.1 hypothetical protein Rsub_02661 [Raphidocelis subcapitata]
MPAPIHARAWLPRILPPVILAALFLAVLPLLSGPSPSLHGGGPGRRRLAQAAGPGADQPPLQGALAPRRDRLHSAWRWDARNIAGLVLSVLVSLVSSVDRECGASPYLVIYAGLLQFPLRQAIALTAFTTFLGSLGPFFAATREAVSTERGPLAATDYASALLILPGMYWGISFGVILNAVLPTWLLALLIVVLLAISNAELIVSLFVLLAARREALAIAARVAARRGLRPAASSGGGRPPPQAASDGATPAAGERLQPQPQPDPGGSDAEDLSRLRALHRRAVKVEAVAQLFPAMHVTSRADVAKAAGVEDLMVLFEADDADAAAAKAAGDAPDALPTGGGEPVPQPPLPDGRWAGLRRWWSLQPGFEWSLALKIVVLHLITEGVRHQRAKPCTRRFWFMLLVMTGLVTLLLGAMAASFARKRLWRGPQFKTALAQVRARRAAADLEAHGGDGGRGLGDDGTRADGAAAAAAEGAGGAGTAAVATPAPALDGISSAAAAAGPPKRRNACAPLGRWWRAHSPFLRGTPEEAVKCPDACVSADGFASWTLPRMIAVEVAAFPLAAISCAVGLPGGPLLAWLLLGLRVKPHVVAATSRFLVTCFLLGSFVAYVIAGNLHLSYALVYGLINLALAPLGTWLFARVAPPSRVLLALSLALGLPAMGVLAATELVPALAHARAMAAGLAAPRPMEDGFVMARFCKAHALQGGGGGR